MKGSKRKRSSAPKDASAATAVVAEVVVQREMSAEIAVELPEAPPAVVVESQTLVATAPDAPSAATFTLLANCNVRDASELRASLLTLIDTDTVVNVDASQLERIDTAALQVLAVFVRDRRAQKREVKWTNVNEVLSEAAHTLGLFAVLEMVEPHLEATQ
jgi:phospholipid transport system transporter-binding protein